MNIKKIISEKTIQIMFQPIMSTHHNDFLAVEALARGFDGQKIISPINLFFEAELEGLTWELDVLCVQKAIHDFVKLYSFNSSLILFVNISATVLSKYLSSSILLDIVESTLIPPENIVLEINELHTDSIETMISFTKKYRSYGFLIALDDIGAGSSNLDRILSIKPNIMKIDKELVRDIHKSFYKEQLVNTILQLATNVGALVVIEGIETTEDLIKVSGQGAQLIQGYLLSKPRNIEPYEIPVIKNNIQDILNILYFSTEKQRSLTSERNKEILRISQLILERLKNSYVLEYEIIIMEFIKDVNMIESVYILDTNGYLITDTILSSYANTSNSSSLYSPCQRGDNVQLEPYYSQLMYAEYDFWITPEYISLATGNKTCTLSRKFIARNKKIYIICIDYYNSKLLANNQLNINNKFLTIF